MKLSEIEGIHCSDCPTTIAYCEKLETRIKELEYERDQLKFDLKEITGGLKDRIAMLEKSNAELHNQCEIYIEQLASARSEAEAVGQAATEEMKEKCADIIDEALDYIAEAVRYGALGQGCHDEIAQKLKEL